MFSSNDFSFEKSSGYDLIKMKDMTGGLTDKIAWPSLPFTIKYFVTPNNISDISIHVTHPVWHDIHGQYSILPAQPPRLAENNLSKRYDHRIKKLPIPPSTTKLNVESKQNIQFYSMDSKVAKMQEIPIILAELSSMHHYAGRNIVAIKIYPIHYRPSNKTIQYLSEAKLRIQFYKSKRTDHSLISTSPRVLGMQLKKLIALVENPQDIQISIPAMSRFIDMPLISFNDKKLIPEKEKFKKFPIVKDNVPFFPPDIIIKPLDQDWSYVIITDNYKWSEDCIKGSFVGNLIFEFEKLARWKTMKGLRARVISISEIVSNKFGNHWRSGFTRDLQEAVRNFLKFAYEHWNTQWCLLGGDINIIPVRHVLGNYGELIIPKEDKAEPDEGKMYFGSFLRPKSPFIRYHSTFEFTKEDVFFALATAEVIRYNLDATSGDPGWYWTEMDYTTKSSIPTRFILIRGGTALLKNTFTVPQYGNMIPTDLYYSSVASGIYSSPDKQHDWDKDNNGFYGWYDYGNTDGIDFIADISVGRAPVTDARSAQTFVEKVLTYELYKDVRTNKSLSSDYQRKLCCVAQSWGVNWRDGPFDKIRWAQLDGACQDKENVIRKLRKIGVKMDLIQRYYDDLFFVPQNESNLFNHDLAHRPKMREAINDGPHFITASGHGWYDGAAGFSASIPDWVHVAGMKNWPNLAIYFVDSCDTNEFDSDIWKKYNRKDGAQAGDPTAVCLGKKVIQWDKGGAVAYVGNSRVGFIGASREISFWETLSIPGHEHLGTMVDRARETDIDYNSAWGAYAKNLMGDPELTIYTESPKVFTVGHCAFVYGKDKLTVSVFHQEQPLIDVNVFVSQMSDTDSTFKVYFPLEEAIEGHYTFDTSKAKDGSKIYIVVTAKNFIPYVGETEKVDIPLSPSKFRTGGFVYDIAQRSTSSIYVGSGDSYLYALSLYSLGLEWKKKLNGPIQDLSSTTDGTLLVGLQNYTTKNLLLVDRTGTEIHTWSLPNTILSVARDVTHGAAYASLIDRGVYCYDINTGKLRWKKDDLKTWCLFVDLDARGNVYTVTSKNNEKNSKLRDLKLSKLSRIDGSVTWDYNIGTWESGWPLALLVEPDGTAYVSTRTSELHKVTPSGIKAWIMRYDPKPYVDASFTSLASFGSTLYAGTGDGYLMAINTYKEPDKSITWKHDLGDRIECIVVDRRGKIYVGCWHGIYAYDTSGKFMWFRETMGGIISLVLSGATLYGGSRDGWVYSVKLTGDTIKAEDINVIDGTVKFKGYDVLSGGSRELNLPVLLKLLSNRPNNTEKDSQSK